MRLIVKGCGAAKLKTPAKAIDMYRGPSAAIVRKYSLPSDAVYILSAEHGLIHGDTVIEPYDKVITAERARELGPDVRRVYCDIVDSNKFDSVFWFINGLYYSMLSQIRYSFAPYPFVMRDLHITIGKQNKVATQWLTGKKISY